MPGLPGVAPGAGSSFVELQASGRACTAHAPVVGLSEAPSVPDCRGGGALQFNRTRDGWPAVCRGSFCRVAVPCRRGTKPLLSLSRPCASCVYSAGPHLVVPPLVSLGRSGAVPSAAPQHSSGYSEIVMPCAPGLVGPFELVGRSESVPNCVVRSRRAPPLARRGNACRPVFGSLP